MTDIPMKDAPWKKLFEPKSKSDWIRKIESDSKGAFSEDQLISDLGEGIHMHAVQTRNDLQSRPHLDDASVYNHVKWKHARYWKIAYEIQYKDDQEQMLSEMDKAVSLGAEQLIIRSSPTENRPFNEDFLEELLSSWPSKYEVEIYTRPSTHYTQVVLSNNENPQTNILGEALCELARSFKTSKYDRDAIQNQLKKLQLIAPMGSNFYLEIARLRALRYLLARFFGEYIKGFDGVLDIPVLAELHPSKKSEATIPDQLLASSTMAISAILGGCSSLVIYPHQDLSSKERLESLRLSTNLQLILRHEAHLGHVSDAAAGSYYVEVLTHQLIQSAWEYYEQER